MISIIIVSLNTKKDFKKSLKSALSQTKKSEIIVIDGKSNDGTIEIIKKNRKNLSAFKIEKDKGIYSAMNKGVKLAKRKWIYFLNSGDIFYNKNTIEKITKILKKNSNFDVLIGNSFIKKDKFLFKSPRKQFSKNSLHSCFSHQSTFVKLNSLKKSPFNPNYKYASDFEFFLKLFKSNKKFFYINNSISINKTGGVSDVNRIEVLNEFKKIILRYNYNLVNYLKITFYIFFSYFIVCIKKTLPKKIIEKISFWKFKFIKY